MQTSRTITIFGGGDCVEGDEVFVMAEALGAGCAKRGWVVANGGYGGTMLAASRAAHAAGGVAVGVTCRIFRAVPNSFITREIATASLHERIQKLIELGDAYIVLPGATGTLAELAVVWELVNKRLLPRRPIVCLGDFWRPVIDLIAGESRRDPRIAGLEKSRSHVGDLVAFADDAEHALALIEKAFRSSIERE